MLIKQEIIFIGLNLRQLQYVIDYEDTLDIEAISKASYTLE